MTTNVINIQGDYVIRVQDGGGLVFVKGNLDVSKDAEVHGNTILGEDRGQTIDPKASFINDLRSSITIFLSVKLSPFLIPERLALTKSLGA